MTHSDSDPRRRLILLGASIRGAAQSARRAGFQVIGVDLFGDTDTRAACDHYCCLKEPPAAIGDALAPFAGAALIQVGGVDGLGCTTGGLLNRFRWLGPSPQQAADLCSPSFLRDLAIASGIKFPPTTSDIARLTRHKSKRWLRKQTRSCGGLGVQWADWDDRVASGSVSQQWIAGRNFGVSFLSDGRRVVMLGVCRSLYTRVGRCPFVYAGCYGPVRLSSEVTRSLGRLGSELVARTSLRGLLNVDVIVDAAGAIWLLEINPRWSGSSEIIERALVSNDRLGEFQSLMGLNYHAMLDSLSSSIHASLCENTCNGTTFLKRVVFARSSGRYRAIDLESPTLQLCDMPREGSPINRGEPMVTLVTAVARNDRSKWREVAGAYRRLRDLSVSCDLPPTQPPVK